ncbi:hypothetical protein L6R29_07295 [Myxococcota bacterium]|nr:hypothetical protein [Myxococcota bacterium]
MVGLDVGGDPAAVLTLQAGTKLLFGEDAVMDVGRVEGGEGGLIVKGTKEAPVVFDSVLAQQVLPVFVQKQRAVLFFLGGACYKAEQSVVRPQRSEERESAERVLWLY